MWFAHKGEAYRLGYAESDDGIRWQRDDSFAGVAPSASGWDSQMVEYAAVARHGDRYFMRSEEHTSELQSLMRSSYAVFCLTTNRHQNTRRRHTAPTLQTRRERHKRERQT